MAKPFIAYASMLRESTSTVTDPGTASGYTFADIYDMRAYKIWLSDTTVKPINIDIDAGAGGAAADYIALVNHNLFTVSATIEVLADTVSPPVTSITGPTALTEDTVSVLTFTSPGAKRYWRIQITTAAGAFTAAPFIGDLFMGLKTTLNEYLAPSFDPFFDDVEVSGARSVGGHYLAGTTRGHQHRDVITFGAAGAARADFTSDLNAFIDNHAKLRKPFFFIVDSGDTDFDTARYVKVPDGDTIKRTPVGGSYARFLFSLPVEEAYMEPVT